MVVHITHWIEIFSEGVLSFLCTDLISRENYEAFVSYYMQKLKKKNLVKKFRELECSFRKILPIVYH